MKQLNGGTIQDLFHYALALKGEENGMDANTLHRRLECGESAKNLLTSLDVQSESEYFEPVVPRPDLWNKEQDMLLAGEALWNKVVEWAQFHGINPRTGETTDISCVVCGKPAMTHATRCYFHTYGTALS